MGRDAEKRLDALVERHSRLLVRLLRQNAHAPDDEDRAMIKNLLYGFAAELKAKVAADGT
jgi:hypothetical protein